jgi:calcium-dependent protein kinase
VDLDKSGSIDYSEFVAATMKMKDLNIEKSLMQAFKIFDIDGNGKITFNEIKEIIGNDLAQQDDEIWKEVLK